MYPLQFWLTKTVPVPGGVDRRPKRPGAGFGCGLKTYGKGAIQRLYPLRNCSYWKLLVSRYYTPSGYDLHGKGIELGITLQLDSGKTVADPTAGPAVQQTVDALKKNWGAVAPLGGGSQRIAMPEAFQQLYQSNGNCQQAK